MTEQHRSEAALLVIDVQRGLLARPVLAPETLLGNITELITAAHAAGGLVVFTRHSNKLLIPGTLAWELQVKPWEGDLLVDKTHGDAFEGTELDQLLAQRSVGTVYVTGLVTEGCVRATCLGAVKRGYHVVLVSDAHSSFHRDAAARIRDWNEKLSAQLGAVTPTREVDFTAPLRPAPDPDRRQAKPPEHH